MREEVRVFFTALMFYTRIPCPKWVDHSEEYINKSVRYFPLIGWIVGAISGIFLYALTYVDPLVASLFYLGISVIMTGAFHEDGFADVCDGFGGGWTKEQILNIMKDSRVGTYAVVGLLVLLLLKVRLVVLIIEESPAFEILFLVCVSAHAMSRWGAATIIFTHEYVRDDEKSKARPVAKSYTPLNVIVSTALGLFPLGVLAWYLNQPMLLLFIPLVYLMKMYLITKFKKKIGGYTGDCLGASQQVMEVLIYLLFVSFWSFF